MAAGLGQAARLASSEKITSATSTRPTATTGSPARATSDHQHGRARRRDPDRPGRLGRHVDRPDAEHVQRGRDGDAGRRGASGEVGVPDGLVGGDREAGADRGGGGEHHVVAVAPEERLAPRALVERRPGPLDDGTDRLGEVHPPHREHDEHAAGGHVQPGRPPPRRRPPRSGWRWWRPATDSPSTIRVNRPKRSAMWCGCHDVGVGLLGPDRHQQLGDHHHDDARGADPAREQQQERPSRPCRR